MKLSKQAIALCVLIFAFVACDQTTPDSPTKDLKFTLTNAAGVNNGDYYEIGTNTLALDFYSADLSYNAEAGEYVGTGYNLSMTDVFVSLASTRLEAGTYIVDAESGKAQSFYPGSLYQKTPYGASLTVVTASNISIHLLNAGKFTVSFNGDSTIIAFDMKTSDGIVVKGEYRGIIQYDEENSDLDYSWEPTEPTTLEYIFTDAEAINYNDAYEIGFDDIELLLENSDAFILLDMICPLKTGLQIPIGKYSINNTYGAHTIVVSSGYIADYGMDIPSFLGIYTDDTKSEYGDTYYLVSGSVDIAKTGDEYAITINGVSYYGSIINATYKGNITVTYDDANSIEQSKPKATVKKRMHSKPATKTLSTQKIIVK